LSKDFAEILAFLISDFQTFDIDIELIISVCRRVKRIHVKAGGSVT